MTAKKEKVVTHVEKPIHIKLKARAKRNRRTIAAEAEILLEKGVANGK